MAYERDVAREPFYHDGTPRSTWAGLDEIARESWERNPTVRAGGHEDVRDNAIELEAENTGIEDPGR
jgi:hypothetical protein